jgi:hypothetical protein
MTGTINEPERLSMSHTDHYACFLAGLSEDALAREYAVRSFERELFSATTAWCLLDLVCAEIARRKREAAEPETLFAAAEGSVS